MGDTLACDSGRALGHAPGGDPTRRLASRQGIISNGRGQTAQPRAPTARLSPKEMPG
ncbi:MAG: hypothetical protein ACLQOO_26180 [Terriglobia bacterium]